MLPFFGVYHKVSFSIRPKQSLLTFRQEMDSKMKKIWYSSTLFSEMNSQYCPAAFIPFFYHSFTHWLSHNMKKRVARREIDGKENRDIPSPPSSGAFPGVPELNGTIALWSMIFRWINQMNTMAELLQCNDSQEKNGITGGLSEKN